MNSAVTRVLSALVLLPVLVALVWWAPALLFGAVLLGAFVIGATELVALLGSPARAFIVSLVYLALPLALLCMIRAQFGPGVLMIMIGTIVASDSGQYYTGRAFGRHKLAPITSPKKTVEGAIGGLIVGSGAAVLLGRFWPIGLSDIAMAGAGLAMTVAGIAGDLFESHLKRRAGVKDSGHLIPGHGGILDRIDSWLFAAPVFWLILRATH